MNPAMAVCSPKPLQKPSSLTTASHARERNERSPGSTEPRKLSSDQSVGSLGAIGSLPPPVAVKMRQEVFFLFWEKTYDSK